MTYELATFAIFRLRIMPGQVCDNFLWNNKNTNMFYVYLLMLIVECILEIAKLLKSELTPEK